MMKVLRTVSVILIAGILLVSCNKNSPKSVATTWLNDFYHADYDAAIPFSTEITKVQLEQFSQLYTYVNDSMKKDEDVWTVFVSAKECGAMEWILRGAGMFCPVVIIR